MNRFVITGCGRSGTKYTAEVLKACGVACGHEEIFNKTTRVEIDDRGTTRFSSHANFSNLDGEVSWMAVPWIDRLAGVLVLHQTREPLACVRSLVARGIFDEHPVDPDYARIVKRTTPRVFDYATPEERALDYWCQWNTIAGAHARYTWQVEQLYVPRLSAILTEIDAPFRGWPELRNHLAGIPKTTNHRGDVPVIEWSAFSAEQLTRARIVASRFGYRVPR
jgi:hypothetical protein